jgi:hypothetical protein
LLKKSCALRNNAGLGINSACGARPEAAAKKGQQEVAEPKKKKKKTASVREREKAGGIYIDQGGKKSRSLGRAFSRRGCGISMNMQNTITKAQWSNA